MLSKPSNQKKEMSNSFSNRSEGSKSKIDSQSIFEKKEDKLYLKINQNNYLYGLLTEINEDKGVTIDYNKFQSFLKNFFEFILISPDFTKLIFDCETSEKTQNSSKITKFYEENYCEQEINLIQKNDEELSVFANNDIYLNLGINQKVEKEEKEDETT